MKPSVVLGLDPGLATFGMAAVATNGVEHFCIGADTFTSEPLARKLDVEVAGDRMRRVRELSRWLVGLERFEPNALAIEAMSFPRGTNAIACICLAWGSLLVWAERHRLPIVTAGPKVWRKGLARDGKEESAHRVAMLAVPTFAMRTMHIDPKKRVHARDALGVFVWSLTTSVVRSVVQR